ncbi:MAG: purine phosphorylase [Alphaproteobacteria bacterium]|nr:purine phosphorylase [Alphaproteobacteria bacterium]
MACKHPGFVTGVLSEAALIPAQLPVRCSGADSARARTQALSLAEQGCDLLISFGLAGGLDPALPSGTLLVPMEIIAPDGRRYASAPEVISLFKNACTDPIAGSDEIVSTPAMKAALFERTHAAAVDMESDAVAEVAKQRGLPFLALRALADGSDMCLPSFIAQAVTPEGHTRLGSILQGLLRQPASLPDLLKLALASRKAFASLKHALPLLKTE